MFCVRIMILGGLYECLYYKRIWTTVDSILKPGTTLNNIFSRLLEEIRFMERISKIWNWNRFELNLLEPFGAPITFPQPNQVHNKHQNHIFYKKKCLWSSNNRLIRLITLRNTDYSNLNEVLIFFGKQTNYLPRYTIQI